MQQLVAGAAQLGAEQGAEQGAAQLGAPDEPQDEPQLLPQHRDLQRRIFGMQSFGILMRQQRERQPLLQLLQPLETGAQQATGAAQVGAQVATGAQAGAQAGAAQEGAHDGAQAGAAQLGAAEQQLLLWWNRPA